MIRRPASAAALAGVSCVVLLAAALASGLPVSGLLGAASETEPAARALRTVVWEIRLPRALLALCLGAGLGAAGAALQALLRNPLAEPGILGISAGGALGAVLAFYSGLTLGFAPLLPMGGFLGAMGVTVLLYLIARRTPGTSGLLLAGVALNSLLGALVALALSQAANPYALYELYFWLMGSLANRSLWHLAAAAPPILVGLGVLIHAAQALEVLVLGEEAAASLGVDLARLRRQVVLGTALAVGPGVAVAGTIGFVGMLVPHLMRGLVASARPRVLVPLSALGGAALTLAADLIAHGPLLQDKLELGVLTALLGAPCFLLVALRFHREARP